MWQPPLGEQRADHYFATRGKSEDTLTMGTLLVIVAAMWGSIQQWPWPMISALFAAAAFSILVYIQFIRPAIRRKNLKRPVRAVFLIPGHHRYRLSYVVQDSDDHSLSELVLPSQSECEIQIMLSPLISFRSSELTFGFDWMGKTDSTKPFPTDFFVPFVERGLRRKSNPDTDPDHYVDFNKHYHIRRDNLHVLGQDAIVGFKIQTRDPGIYKAQLSFKAEEVEGKAELTVRIEDQPQTPMRCVCHGHLLGPLNAPGVQPRG